MPIFSFVRYIQPELFEKNKNWRQLYRETSSNFYTSNNVSLKLGVKKNFLL